MRDEAGERVIAARRSAARAAITEPVLRREVTRDLEQLMNSISLASVEDLQPFEAVQNSIVNYGCPDIAHRTIDEAGVYELEEEIRLALTHFEPRLIADSIKVSRDERADPVSLKLRFTVRADLICTPMNVPVEFTADVDFESGNIAVARG